MILEIGEYGWAKIYIGDNGSIFTGKASYLRDTPMEILEAFKLYIDKNIIPTIKCDEEGSEFIIVVDEYTTHIISERNIIQHFSWDISCKDFILQTIDDIEHQLDNAISFMCDEDDENKQETMLFLIQYIKENLNEK